MVNSRDFFCEVAYPNCKTLTNGGEVDFLSFFYARKSILMSRCP